MVSTAQDSEAILRFAWLPTSQHETGAEIKESFDRLIICLLRLEAKLWSQKQAELRPRRRSCSWLC